MEIAEASKVIENVQRDMNIALVNELARILLAIGIDVEDVLSAAETKWNFHRYTQESEWGSLHSSRPLLFDSKSIRCWDSC
jgi:UDP-N-acetyl-D-glucosamine/UDP-N-acetyl-D-galactosamine dehydrogenase